MFSEYLQKHPPPKKGAGCCGKGLPIHVQKGNWCRGLFSGCGLCSPGRWPLAQRRLPDTRQLAGQLVRLLYAWKEPKQREKLTYQLACGQDMPLPGGTGEGRGGGDADLG